MHSILRTFVFLIVSALTGATATAAGLPEIEVWKDPNCGCCTKWIDHMRQAGFDVNAHDTARVDAARAKLDMPTRYAACHTARVGGYVIEGHVPAADVKRLLEEQPEAVGLAVPGMPMGSPGMEGPHSESYQTLLIGRSGKASVFAEH